MRGGWWLSLCGRQGAPGALGGEEEGRHPNSICEPSSKLSANVSLSQWTSLAKTKLLIISRVPRERPLRPWSSVWTCWLHIHKTFSDSLILLCFVEPLSLQPRCKLLLNTSQKFFLCAFSVMVGWYQSDLLECKEDTGLNERVRKSPIRNAHEL